MRSRISRGEPPTIVAHDHVAPCTGVAWPAPMPWDAPLSTHKCRECPSTATLDTVEVDITDPHTIMEGTIDFLAPLLCLTKHQKGAILKDTYFSGIPPDAPWRIHHLDPDHELHAIVVFAYGPKDGDSDERKSKTKMLNDYRLLGGRLLGGQPCHSSPPSNQRYRSPPALLASAVQLLPHQNCCRESLLRRIHRRIIYLWCG